MPEENKATYLNYLRKCEPRILYLAKMTFKYKGHKLLSTRISEIILMSTS